MKENIICTQDSVILMYTRIFNQSYFFVIDKENILVYHDTHKNIFNDFKHSGITFRDYISLKLNSNGEIKNKVEFETYHRIVIQDVFNNKLSNIKPENYPTHEKDNNIETYQDNPGVISKALTLSIGSHSIKKRYAQVYGEDLSQLNRDDYNLLSNYIYYDNKNPLLPLENLEEVFGGKYNLSFNSKKTSNHLTWTKVIGFEINNKSKMYYISGSDNYLDLISYVRSLDLTYQQLLEKSSYKSSIISLDMELSKNVIHNIYKRGFELEYTNFNIKNHIIGDIINEL